MTYREMAMDAGCTSEEEIAQMVQMLEWEEQMAYEEWCRQKWEEEMYYADMAEEELRNERNSELQMHGVD